LNVELLNLEPRHSEACAIDSSPIELICCYDGCRDPEIQAERKYHMDAEAKKTALRMIPYGIYVLTGESKDGRVAAATVNWVTQTAFQPPLVVIGVKADSGAHAIIKESKVFALNMLGKDQKGQAFTFFKPLEREGNSIGGEPFRKGILGAPILEKAPAFVECALVNMVEMGDHSIFVGEVKDAGVAVQPSGRPDDAILAMRDLGDKVFYGG
jgi:flavin reductase (DIM6/NTAB) family NADH-FMN oxidoreductase RutF